MGLCGLKKLDRLRSLAGDGGTLARDSIVRSDKDGLDFFGSFREPPLLAGETGVSGVDSDSSLLSPSPAKSDCMELCRVYCERLLAVEAIEFCLSCCPGRACAEARVCRG